MSKEERVFLCAFQLDGKGGARELDDSEVSNTRLTNVWLHLDAPSWASGQDLIALANTLDENSANSLLLSDIRPRCLQIGESILLMLRGVNLNADSAVEDMVGIRLWIEPGRVLSARYRQLSAVQDIRQRLLAGKGPKSTSELIVDLCTGLLQRIEPVISELDDHIAALEESIIEDQETDVHAKVSEIRKKVVLLRRYIAPQRDALNDLRRADVNWMSAKQRRALQEAYDQITRLVEALDAIRDRAQLIRDDVTNVQSQRLGRNLYLLSVITAIFLPLSFLTGLFGINIGGMPGVQSPTAFSWFLGATLLIAAVQIIIMKWKNWF